MVKDKWMKACQEWGCLIPRQESLGVEKARVRRCSSLSWASESVPISLHTHWITKKLTDGHPLRHISSSTWIFRRVMWPCMRPLYNSENRSAEIWGGTIPRAALQKEERWEILFTTQLSKVKYWKLLVLSFLDAHSFEFLGCLVASSGGNVDERKSSGLGVECVASMSHTWTPSPI